MARRSASHVDSAAQVGGRLREARTERGLRLRDLAFPGCSVGYLSHIERGARIPSLQVLRALADVLDVSEQWLATGAYDERSDHDVLAAAEAALRFDDLDTAGRLYRTTVDRASDDRTLARARAGLGQLAFRLDDAETAMAELEAARELDATLLEDDGFVDTLGRVHAHLGDV